MLIKASAITNLTDARYFAAQEVHFLGFNLEEGTPGYLDPMYMKAIREWVQGPKITGEFDRTPAAVVREAAAFYGLDSVQVTRTDDLALLEGLDVILAVPATAETDAIRAIFKQAAAVVRYFLLDFTTLPNAVSLLLDNADDWKQLFTTYPTLLHLDAPALEISRILDALQPAGLALRGGEEELVGVKSFDEIDAIFEIL
jgi:phosphoribosylanthranilate isomerase